MPYLIPTLAEQQHTSWHVRQVAGARLANALDDITEAIDTLIAAVPTAQLVARCSPVDDFDPDEVRQDATALLERMPPDPRARFHWIELAVAIGATNELELSPEQIREHATAIATWLGPDPDALHHQAVATIATETRPYLRLAS